MKKEVFISYSSKDTEIAHEIYKAIEDCGITVWIAPDCIPIGANYGGAIELAIEECSIMVVVYSNACNASEHVANEIDTAFNEGKLIIPFCIDDSPMSRNLRYYLRRKQHLNAFPNYKVHIQKLLDALCSSLGRSNIKIDKQPEAGPTSIPHSIDMGHNAPNVEPGYEAKKDRFKRAGESFRKVLRTSMDVYTTLKKEYADSSMYPFSSEALWTDDMPKALLFDFEDRKFYMILSEDKKYYIVDP